MGAMAVLAVSVHNLAEGAAIFAIASQDVSAGLALAFGVGVDRVASLKYGISDIRLEYENDARFLRQF